MDFRFWSFIPFLSHEPARNTSLRLRGGRVGSRELKPSIRSSFNYIAGHRTAAGERIDVLYHCPSLASVGERLG